MESERYLNSCTCTYFYWVVLNCDLSLKTRKFAGQRQWSWVEVSREEMLSELMFNHSNEALKNKKRMDLHFTWRAYLNVMAFCNIYILHGGNTESFPFPWLADCPLSCSILLSGQRLRSGTESLMGGELHTRLLIGLNKAAATTTIHYNLQPVSLVLTIECKEQRKMVPWWQVSNIGISMVGWLATAGVGMNNRGGAGADMARINFNWHELIDFSDLLSDYFAHVIVQFVSVVRGWRWGWTGICTNYSVYCLIIHIIERIDWCFDSSYNNLTTLVVLCHWGLTGGVYCTYVGQTNTFNIHRSFYGNKFGSPLDKSAMTKRKCIWTPPRGTQIGILDNGR